MTISDIAMITAVILGPVLAVQAQKWIEQCRDVHQRKLWVFKTLMATRGAALSPPHVQALNMIDLEFSDKRPKEKDVREAWKLYLDHLCEGPRDIQAPDFQTRLTAWSLRSQDCLVDLLHTMGKALGYHFDKVQLKKGAYAPQGHVDIEFEHSLIRKATLNVLTGQDPLQIQVVQRGQKQP